HGGTEPRGVRRRPAAVERARAGPGRGRSRSLRGGRHGTGHPAPRAHSRAGGAARRHADVEAPLPGPARGRRRCGECRVAHVRADAAVRRPLPRARAPGRARRRARDRHARVRGVGAVRQRESKVNSLRARLIWGFSLVAVVPLALALALLGTRIRQTMEQQSGVRLEGAIRVARGELVEDGQRLAARLALLARDAQLKRLYLVDTADGLELRQFLAE